MNDSVALDGVAKTVCGMKCIDLVSGTIEILGTFFSYNKNL